MLLTHKIEYFKDGKKHKMLNIPYEDKNDIINDILADEDILDATIQEYPLKFNEIRPFKKDGEDVFEPKERKHMVSFSGGKDSTAMLIRMLELGMQIDEIVFVDTKYELPETYGYVDDVEKYIQNRFDPELSITRISTDEKLEDWLYGKVTRGKMKGQIRGFPLMAYPCYWSRESKVAPLDRYMQGHHRYIGIAIDESNRVAKNAEKRLYNYPLVEWGWTEQDCADYLEDIDLMNPTYSSVIKRTGCWWCPKQPIGSWKTLFLNYPEKWQYLIEAEAKVGRPIREDYSMVELDERFKRELEEEQNE